MATAVPAEGFFLEISGLPLHPLVVHAAVVLVPLSALGLVAIVLVPRWRRPLGWVVMAGLLIGAGASFVAKESGEALAGVVGQPADHAKWGDILPPVAFLLFVVGAVWFWLWRRDDKAAAAAAKSARKPLGSAATSPRSDIWTTVAGIASIVASLAVLGLTFLVGHSGAEAVWGGRLAAATTTTGPTPAPSGSGSAAAGGYTLAQVQQHANANDCWSVVNGNVYDLTSWIGQHPGGPGVIQGMCGTDATSSFEGQHAGQPRPADELSRFLLGPLAVSGGASSAAATPTAAASPTASPTAATSATAEGNEDSAAGASTYALAEVAKHASASDCWSAVDGGVYDLTAWIDQHPGGPQVIEAICGKDGTAAFNGQHEGQGEPAQTLADFKIGTLG